MLRVQQSGRGILVALPVLVYFFVFLVIPLGLVAVLSVLSRDSYGEVRFIWNPGNYVRLFDGLYLKILVDSLLMALSTTAITLLIGYPVAYYIARSPERRRSWLLLAVLVPFWTNFIIRTYAWILILREDGLLNAALLKSGLVSTPLDILFTPTAVLIGMVYEFLPFIVLPLYSTLEKIDEAQLAAAADLGARPFAVFSRIVLPLSTPGLIAGSLLVFIPAIGMFALPDLMGGARTVLVGNLIRNQFLVARDWPFGAAAAMLLVGLSLSLLLWSVRFSRAEWL